MTQQNNTTAQYPTGLQIVQWFIQGPGTQVLNEKYVTKFSKHEEKIQCLQALDRTAAILFLS